MFLRAHRVFALAARTPTIRITSFFSKEAPKKDGKKDDKAAPVAVIEETPIEELALRWINPNHNALSPSELKYLHPHTGFTRRDSKTFPPPTRNY
jgi:hypothetical protein